MKTALTKVRIGVLMGGRSAEREVSLMSGGGVLPKDADWKLVARATYLELPFFDHMHRFLPALVQRAGGATLIVEVNHRPRTRGRSNYGVLDRLWVGIVDLFGVLWLKRRAARPEVSEVKRP